ncbi:MAG: hypothetical protein ACYTEZ_16925 [Planctomycetota bacterium]
MGTYWQCPHCGEKVERNFEVCWSCQRPRPPGTVEQSDPEQDLKEILAREPRAGCAGPTRTFVLVSTVVTLAALAGTLLWGFGAGLRAAIACGIVAHLLGKLHRRR